MWRFTVAFFPFETGICYTLHDKGMSYRGNVAVTKSGQRCVEWSHHLHTFKADQFRYDGLEKNYCRNPVGKREAPWCYKSPTGKEEESWEYCEVEICGKLSGSFNVCLIHRLG